MRKSRVSTAAFMLVFGLIPLLRILSTPRLENLHGSDVVQLLASGALFGIGITVLFRSFKFRGE
jgi:hypothetical protein